MRQDPVNPSRRHAMESIYFLAFNDRNGTTVADKLRTLGRTAAVMPGVVRVELIGNRMYVMYSSIRTLERSRGLTIALLDAIHGSTRRLRKRTLRDWLLRQILRFAIWQSEKLYQAGAVIYRPSGFDADSGEIIGDVYARAS